MRYVFLKIALDFQIEIKTYFILLVTILLK